MLYEYFVAIKQTTFSFKKKRSTIIFFPVTSAPSKKSSIQPGDRLIEINGIKYTEFKTAKRANDLFDTMVLDVEPKDDETDSDEEDSDSESEGEIESESQDDE
jgi:predicted metalloprotease with PDZ domain